MTTSGQKRRKPPQTEIRFPIERRTDRHKKQYWLGWTDAPASLDLRECAFFIFVGDNPEVCIRRRDDNREIRVRTECDGDCYAILPTSSSEIDVLQDGCDSTSIFEGDRKAEDDEDYYDDFEQGDEDES